MIYVAKTNQSPKNPISLKNSKQFIKDCIHAVLSKLASLFSTETEYDPFDPYRINEYVSNALKIKEIRKLRDEIKFNAP
jgi:hypothetical protein